MSVADGKGYQVPNPVDPGELACFRVYVPKHTWYIGAFWAAYEFFTSWLAWARDPLRRGKQAAAVWRVAYDKARAEFEASGGVCEMNVTGIRQNPLNPCELQAEFDGNNVWVAVADLSKCNNGCGSGDVLRYSDGEVQRYDSCGGTWQPAGPATPFHAAGSTSGTLPASSDTPCLAATNIAHVMTVPINDVAVAEVGLANILNLINIFAAAFAALTPGFEWFDLISAFLESAIEGLTGSWSDVNDLDIEADVAGILAGHIDYTGGISQEESDAIVAALAAKAGSYADFSVQRVKWNMYYFCARGLGASGMVKAESVGGITVPSCSTIEWSKTFDFTASKNEFVNYISATGTGGVWTPTVGWKNSLDINTAGQYQAVLIQRGWASAHIDNVTIEFDATFGVQAPPARIELNAYPFADGGTNYATHGIAEGDGQSWTFNLDADVAGIAVALLVGLNTGVSADPGGSGRIKRIILTGTGSNPFI